MIFHVKQRRTDDCGVACVAMLAEVTYERALEVMFPKSHKLLDTKRATTTHDIANGLERLGIKAAHRLVAMRGKAPEYSTICRVNWPDQRKWHWVFMHKFGAIIPTIWWYDPKEEGHSRSLYPYPSSYLPLIK